MTVALRQILQTDLTAAMKARDTQRISVLRSTLSAVANAEAFEVATPVTGRASGRPTEVDRKELSESDITTIVRREHEELAAAAEEFSRLGETERAEGLHRQAELLAIYLGE
jgi:uncharacterized protein